MDARAAGRHQLLPEASDGQDPARESDLAAHRYRLESLALQQGGQGQRDGKAGARTVLGDACLGQVHVEFVSEGIELQVSAHRCQRRLRALPHDLASVARELQASPLEAGALHHQQLASGGRPCQPDRHPGSVHALRGADAVGRGPQQLTEVLRLDHQAAGAPLHKLAGHASVDACQLPFQLPDPGLASVVLHQLLKGLVAQPQPLLGESVRASEAREQMPARDLDLVLIEVAAQVHDLQPVAQGRRDALLDVGGSHEDHFAQVEGKVQVVVHEGVILRGVQDLEQGGGRVATFAAQLVQLVQDDDRVSGPGPADCLNDAAGHGPDVGAAVAADLGLVAHSPQGHSLATPPQRLRRGLRQRGLAGARWPHEAEGCAPGIGVQLPDGQVLQDAILGAVQAVVIGVQDESCPSEVLFIDGRDPPGELSKPLKPSTKEHDLGGVRWHGGESLQLPQRFSARFGGHARHFDALAEQILGPVLLSQLFATDTDLLAQDPVPLPALQVPLHLLLDRVRQLHHVPGLGGLQHQQLQAAFQGGFLQQGLLELGWQLEHARRVAREAARPLGHVRCVPQLFGSASILTEQTLQFLAEQVLESPATRRIVGALFDGRGLYLPARHEVAPRAGDVQSLEALEEYTGTSVAHGERSKYPGRTAHGVQILRADDLVVALQDADERRTSVQMIRDGQEAAGSGQEHRCDGARTEHHPSQRNQEHSGVGTMRNLMELPATFGKYQLLERIATGGMAEVFLARSFGVEGFEKRLVIKRILPQLARSPHFVSLFIQEAKISVLLNHPNIVQVFDLGRVKEDHYIAMEHIHGHDLTRTVRRLRAAGRRMPIHLAVWITAALARGLAYAHSRVDAEGVPLNIVHRDVSPHNVLLSFEGQVKLVDFGIARLIGREEDRGAGAGGKFAYMSPEQARGEAIDHRSDIFSCAIVLYELLVDHRLFQDPDPEEKLRKVREAVVPDVRLENPDVPEPLWTILKQALALKPDDRWASAGHLEEELRGFLFEDGHRVEEPMLRDFLMDLFEDEVGPDPAAAQLHNLAHELARLEGEDSERSTIPTDSTMEEPSSVTPRPIGEKKTVAVLVAEVVGLTDASEIIEPEEVLQQQDLLMKSVRRVASRYMGWVDKFAMDTVTVLFGIPRAHEDDTDRALACAQDLVAAAIRLQQCGQPVGLALGVHRGEVAVRHVGEELQYVPRGNVVKLARRLAALAEPSEIAVSDLVAGETGDRWRFNVGPRLRWKGSREESTSYLLTGRRRRLGGQGGRWIRRGNELDVLASALGRLARGQGGVVAISGGAGTGKTRLLRELRELSDAAGVPIYTARAYPYGGNHPLAPFRDLIAAVLGIDLDDDREEIEARLSRLSQLHLTVEQGANIAKLFAVDMTRVVTPTKEAMYAAGTRFLRGVVEDSPALVTLEDVQYLEPKARLLMAHIIRSTANERCLYLLTWRGREPEDLPAPEHRIVLEPLSTLGVRQLLRDLLAAREVSDELLELVQTSARGNPLYAVEVVKALERRRHIRYQNRTAVLAETGGEPLLPPTLGGLIASQVDGLDPATKGALQIAATVGLSFSAALVGEAAGLGGPDALLRELVDSGLIMPEGEGAYSFASHLVWQVVRRSILGVRLRDHHRLVAEAIERLYSDRLDAWAESVAAHCAACGRLLDAARYANRAGDQHRDAAFLERALACYRRGIEWLETAAELDSGPDAFLRGEAMLHLKSGEVALLVGRSRDSERHLQVALDLADEGMFGDIESRCFLALGRLYMARGKLVLAEANLDQGLASAANDQGLRVELLVEHAALSCERGAYERADELLSKAAGLAGNDDGLVARSKLGLANRYQRDDRPEVAWKLLEEARTSAEASGDRILLGRVLNNLGIALYALEDHSGALERFREALEVRRGSGYQQGIIINLHNIGDSHLRLGDFGKAHAAFSEALRLAEDVGLERSVVLNRACLDYLAATQGDEGAMEQLGGAEALARKLGDTETALAIRLMHGRLLMASDSEQATEQLRSALEEARSVGHAWLARDLERELLS